MIVLGSPIEINNNSVVLAEGEHISLCIPIGGKFKTSCGNRSASSTTADQDLWLASIPLRGMFDANIIYRKVPVTDKVGGNYFKFMTISYRLSNQISLSVPLCFGTGTERQTMLSGVCCFSKLFTCCITFAQIDCNEWEKSWSQTRPRGRVLTNHAARVDLIHSISSALHPMLDSYWKVIVLIINHFPISHRSCAYIFIFLSAQFVFSKSDFPSFSPFVFFVIIIEHTPTSSLSCNSLISRFQSAANFSCSEFAPRW